MKRKVYISCSTGEISAGMFRLRASEVIRPAKRGWNYSHRPAGRPVSLGIMKAQLSVPLEPLISWFHDVRGVSGEKAGALIGLQLCRETLALLTVVSRAHREIFSKSYKIKPKSDCI